MLWTHVNENLFTVLVAGRKVIVHIALETAITVVYYLQKFHCAELGRSTIGVDEQKSHYTKIEATVFLQISLVSLEPGMARRDKDVRMAKTHYCNIWNWKEHQEK